MFEQIVNFVLSAVPDDRFFVKQTVAQYGVELSLHTYIVVLR